jgi:hypothetical protein
MKAKSKPKCRINDFLPPDESAKVFRLIERISSGLSASALANWHPEKGSIPNCPYADMSGEESEHCKEFCHIYELAIRDTGTTEPTGHFHGSGRD